MKTPLPNKSGSLRVPPRLATCLSAPGLLALAVLFAPSRLDAVSYTVSGNHTLQDGAVWQIHGVARSGYETSPTGDGHFTQADMDTIAGWNSNTVRIAFNESYMLSDSSCFDSNYLGRLDAAVTAANNAGLNVIFDLHWNTANTTGCATSQQNMADRRSLTAWQTMANRYKTNPRVFFELYNEPHDITWSVWRNGNSTWAGMQEMYDRVRNNGFNNLVLIGGLNWAYDLSGVPSNRVTGNNIVYVTHPYDFAGKQPGDWPTGFGFLTATDPVCATEFGAFNCTTSYVISALNYYDAPAGDTNRRMGWTGWAWNDPNSCGFPSIISNWTGGASTMGQPEKDRLLGYGGPPPPPPPTPSGTTIEAEATALTNYTVESVSAASNGQCIKINSGATGNGRYNFSGTTGTYDLKVWYFDENDGACPLKLYVNGVVVDSWTANANLGSTVPDAATRTSRTKVGVSITNGNEIKIEGTQNADAFARFDKVEVTAPTAPPVPTGLTATAGDAQVSLSWSASSGATSYNVKRSTTSGGPYSTIASPTTTSYTDTGLTNGTTYYYVVSAVNSVGESANSSQVSATPSAGPSGTTKEAEDMTLTNYVVNTNTSASNGNLIKLSAAGVTGTATYAFSGTTGTYDIKVWYYDENDGACAFSVFVGSTQVDSWTANLDLGSADPVAATRTSRTKTGVSITNGATIKLQAVQNSQEWGRFDLVELLSPSPTPPTPTGLTATAGNGQVSLSWNASTGASSYNVKRSTTSGGPYTTIASPATTSYTDTGLTNGTTYYYVVSAVNASGESSNSTQVSATPAAGGSANTHGGTWACKGVIPSTASFKNISEVRTATSNSTYVASIWIKGTGSVELQVKAGNWGSNITSIRADATSTWTQVSTLPFSTGSNTQLTFVLQDSYSGASGTCYIDDVFLGVSGGANVLANPGFESGNTSWTVNGTVFSIVQP